MGDGVRNGPSGPAMGIQVNVNPQALMNQGRCRVQEFHDGLLYTVIAAEAGDPGARADLKAVLEILERAKLAASGLSSGTVLVR